MIEFKQPSVFISHGTIYEAFKNTQLKAQFEQLRFDHIPTKPAAIVIFSGHWQTENITVSTSNTMSQMDEGFPKEFQTSYSTAGNPELSTRIVEMLKEKNIKVDTDAHRQLDHGALIPLLLLFPNEKIPVILLSQQANLDPLFHKKIAEILNPLRSENILFIGSGGLTHNRNEIKRFVGHEMEPDHWAKEFESFITTELSVQSTISSADKMIAAYEHQLFSKSHPTSEHFLPLVFSSAFGGEPTQIFKAFQWKNLSMSAFKFL